MNTTTNALESTAMPCRAEIGPTLPYLERPAVNRVFS